MVLKAELREKTGTGASKKARSEGKIPVALYGGKDQVSLLVDRKEFETILKKEGANAVFDLEYDGKKQKVLIKDFARSAMKNDFYSIDLQGISANQKLQVEVPLVLVNVETVKEGIVEQVLNAIQVESKPDNIPGNIEVDVEGLEIGNVLTVADLKMPEDVVVLEDQEKTVVTVSLPTEEPAAEASEDEEATEPEVIGEEEKTEE